MLVIEQLVSPHSHSYSPYPSTPSHNSDVQLHSVKNGSQPEQFDVEFDASLEDPEQGNNPRYPEASSSTYTPEIAGPTSSRAFPLTLGLFIHGIADGLALGASALAPDDPHASSHLSLIVFIALIIHKGKLPDIRTICSSSYGPSSSHLAGINHISPRELSSPLKMQEISRYIQHINTHWSNDFLPCLLFLRTRG
jgi:zinc transporter 9